MVKSKSNDMKLLDYYRSEYSLEGGKLTSSYNANASEFLTNSVRHIFSESPSVIHLAMFYMCGSTLAESFAL